MTKKEENKIITQIEKLIGDEIKESDYILIYELIDWIKISSKAKDELKDSVKNGENMNWQILTTIAMSSKQIQSIMQRLNITPDKRSRNKQVDKKQSSFDLQRFLHE
jgi:hypothetical protein